jgi:hypothetical protein
MEAKGTPVCSPMNRGGVREKDRGDMHQGSGYIFRWKPESIGRPVRLRNLLTASFFLGLILSQSVQAFAGWEIGARVGFESNVDRSIEDGKGDSYFTGYGSFSREPSSALRFDWGLRIVIEGTAYAELSGLNYGAVTLAPGITFSPQPTWSANLSPFIEAKEVNDSDQSAVAVGAKVNLNQLWKNGFYTGQYYIYTDSRAEVDTYSFTENMVGAFFGISWNPSFFSEIGYEFSRGDSFRAISTTSTMRSIKGAELQGKHRRYSATFGTDVVRESVDRHAIAVNVGFDLTESLFSLLNYTLATAEGDLGTSTFHSGFIGIGYQFP